jgi:tetratricopeptide (TPR) repeat protein
VGYSPLLRLTMSLYGLVFYVWKTILPAGLSAQYVFDPHPEPFTLRLLAGSVAAVAISAAALAFWRKRPYFLAAWAAFAVSLLPVLSFLRLDTQQYVADHHSYLASVPIAALLAGGWALWAARWPRTRPRGVAMLVLAALAGLTIRQIGYWESSKVLWARALETSPLSVTAHNNYGRALADEGRAAEAIEHFRRAVEIDPLFAHARYNLGHQLMQQGKLDEAETNLRAAVEREPGNPRSLNAVGNVLARQ